MEFTSQYQLYKMLLPAFNVKKRLMKYQKNINITNEDIWKYLITSKWKNAYDLTLSEMVNDIISLPVENIRKVEHDEKEN